jgi:hypothetical protein
MRHMFSLEGELVKDGGHIKLMTCKTNPHTFETGGVVYRSSPHTFAHVSYIYHTYWYT